MGQYFKIVNVSKKQFIDIDSLGENNKLGFIGQGLNGIALGRLLTSSGKDWDEDFFKAFGNPNSDKIYMGIWAGDKIVVAGDYDEPDTNGIKTSDAENGNRNLYDKTESDYENITDEIIKWLANDEQTAEMLVNRAEKDSELLQKLSDLVFIEQNKQMKKSLEKILGSDWTKRLKK
ncbi:hypothetical protein [Mangrovimonas sp. YM274]|uniref:hypothetical protein n=1 Tax=Mangrovimonas sp. YM274 TaxID=3070660 RepID=UPI0027DD235E|nr:hypothetical protein [Mangrovimonas sp. YM274]WMI68216.1 hypothetical protein RBH95_13820 [Mangrovimonas sp. YM274]